MSQQQLGEAVGVSAQVVLNWERGHTGIPAEELPNIARALGVTVAEFFDEADPPPHRAHVEQLVSVFRQAVEQNPQRIEITVYTTGPGKTARALGRFDDDPTGIDEPPPNVTPSGLKLIQRWPSMSEDEQREWLELAEQLRATEWKSQ